MLQTTKIQAAMLNLVGWRRDFGAPDPVLGEGVYNPETTESGLYFQDAHPLLTLENIRNTMPENVTAEKFNDYLKYLTEKAIAHLMQNFVRIKQLNGETKTLLDDRVLFYGSANKRHLSQVPENNDFVGFSIEPTKSAGISFKLNRIGFQFDENVQGITVYVAQAGEAEPSYVLEYTQTIPAFTTKWINISEFTINGGDEHEVVLGGSDKASQYLIYYDVKSLTPQPVSPLNIGRDWSKAPCSCNRQHYDNFMEISKYVSIYPFTAPVPEDVEVPFNDTLCRNYRDNFGLNIQFTMACDITDLVIKQKSMFANALQKQLASDVLREMAMNPPVRVNRNQANVSRMELLYELDGSSEKPSGINYELKKTLEALDFDTKGMDRVCLQCKNKGVRYGSV